MIKPTFRTLGCAPLLACAIGASAAAAGEVEVRISGFPAENGQARIVLMAGEQGYLGSVSPARIGVAAIKNGRAVWRARDLQPGDYAIIAHHDADGNDALNRPIFNLPVEPYGYSGGAWTSFGLPGWREVAFEVSADGATSQSITLRKNLFAQIGEAAFYAVAPLLAVLAGLWLLRRGRRKPAGRSANGVS